MQRLWIAGAAALLLPVSASAQTAEAGITLDGNRLVLPKPVRFSPPTAMRFRPKGDATLDVVARWMAEKSYISTLRIEGHVADVPNAQQISNAQAHAVARALVRKGVDCKRLIITGFGDTKPVAAVGDAANTRIEFINAALRGRAIGGLPLDGGGQVMGDSCALTR